MRDHKYVAVYESHHVIHLQDFESYDQAAALLQSWASDVHSWPIAIYDRGNNRLWLWSGYRTLNLGRETALSDACAVLNLPPDHQFAAIEFTREGA